MFHQHGIIEVFINAIVSFAKDETLGSLSLPSWSGSYLVFDIITYSELFDRSWTVSKESDLLQYTPFPLDATSFIQRFTYYKNFIYNDTYANQFPPPNTQSRILIQNGDIDDRTPLSWAQYYKSQTNNFSNLPHFVMYNSSGHGLSVPLRNPTIGNHTCGIQSFVGFIYNTIAPENNTCLSAIIPYKISTNDSRALMKVLGIPFDPYEDGILPLSFATIIVIILIALSICSCITAIISYFICCRKFDVEVPVQYTLM